MVELILATNCRSIAVLFGEAVNVFLKKKFIGKSIYLEVLLNASL